MPRLDPSRILFASMRVRWRSPSLFGRRLLPMVVLLPAIGLSCGGPPSGDVDARLAGVMSMLHERSAESFESGIEDNAETGVGELLSLGEVVSTAPPDEKETIAAYLVEAARSRGRRLALHGPPWSDENLAGWLALVFLDPARFAAEDEFRRFVVGIAGAALDPAVSVELRDALLGRIHRVDGMGFADAERIELAWGVARRSSLERANGYSKEGGRVIDDLGGPIEASIYSFPSGLIDMAAASRFLEAVRRGAPERALLVLSDPPLVGELERFAGSVELQVIRSYGAPYSPWPRDPFSFSRRADDGVLLLLRPNLQQMREADHTMGLELIQGLPDELDEAWGRPIWERSPVPFHNGHLLPVGDAIWLSAHGLELRILQLLGETAIPVDRLGTNAGWQRYTEAAHRAAAEVGELYGRKPLFVHPMEKSDHALLAALGGGAGFDLDTLVTPLLSADGRMSALVGDIGDGTRLLQDVSVEELDAFAESYRLGVGGEALRRGLLESQRGESARGLARFVDLVAAHLERSGTTVERLPLLLVAAELAPREQAPLGQPFLVSWNNIVQEERGGRRRAEGFSGGLRSGDRLAQRRFSELGYRLELLPALVESVVRNGGYRCASQHLRR